MFICFTVIKDKRLSFWYRAALRGSRPACIILLPVSRVESAAADAINASDDGDDDDVDGDNDKLMNNRHLLVVHAVENAC